MATVIERSEPAAPAHSTGGRRTVVLLLVALVAVQSVVAWLVAHGSFFTFDDFSIFSDFRYGVGINLWASNGGHLNPGYRVLHWLVYRGSHAHWGLSLAIVIAFHAASTVLLQRILARVFGNAWWTFALALGFGVATINLSLFIDFTLSSTYIPALTFSLAAIHAHLVWLQGGRNEWLVWSALAVGLGLLFYEKVALVPLTLVLMWVFVLDEERSVADGARAALRAWRVWLVYAVPLAAFGIAYLAGDYGSHGGGSSLGQILQFLWTAWLRAFGAGIFGLFVGPGPPTAIETAGIVFTQLALVALIAVSIVRRRGAWRAWAFFAIVFAIGIAVLNPRLEEFGPVIGANLRYVAETTYLFPLALAFAFARPRTAAAAPGEPVPPRGLPLAGVAAAVAVIAAFTVLGTLASSRAAVGPDASSWFHNLRHDVAAAGAAGRTPSVLDGNPPDAVVPGFARIGPRTRHFPRTLSDMAALLDIRLRFDPGRPPVSRIADDGHLQPVTFLPVSDEPLLTAAKAGRAVTDPGQLIPEGRFDCMTAGPLGGGVIEYVPAHALRGKDWYLAVEVKSTTIALDVSVDRGIGYPISPDRVLPTGAGRPGNVSVTQVGGLPTGVPTFAKMRIFVPKSTKACFGRVRIGSFEPAS